MAERRGGFFQDYHNHPRSTWYYNLLSHILWPLSLLFRTAVFLRGIFYKLGLLKAHRLSHPVISIGNLTTGGTGKTPVEIFLIEMCAEMKLRPLLLSRGYGAENSKPRVIDAGDGMSELPDELKMIHKNYPETAIAYCRDRLKAYLLALTKFEFDLVLLDDGFQHIQIERDLDIVVLDSQSPFGSNRLLPSGNLRETGSSLKRADMVLINYKSNHDFSSLKLFARQIGRPLLAGNYRVSEVISIKERKAIEISKISGKKAGLVTAIGAPASFIEILESLDVEIEQSFLFRDHHRFTPEDMRVIASKSENAGLECLFTTEKDAVKIENICFLKPPVYVIKIKFCLEYGAERLTGRIKRIAPETS